MDTGTCENVCNYMYMCDTVYLQFLFTSWGTISMCSGRVTCHNDVIPCMGAGARYLVLYIRQILSQDWYGVVHVFQLDWRLKPVARGGSAPLSPLRGSRSAYVQVRCGSRPLPEATPGLLARVIIYISAETLKLNRKPTLDHRTRQTSTCTNS